MTAATRHRPANPLHRHDWQVDVCTLGQARALIERLHYAAGLGNTATFRHGLYQRECWPLELAGAAVWLPPTRGAAEATWPGDWQAVLALSRLVIEPGAPTNAASFLLAGSVRLIRTDPRWRCLVTYADEWQGHTGAIYRAAGWEYVGRTDPERVYTIDGRMASRRAGPSSDRTSHTHAEMLARGATFHGYHARHKFRKVLT